MIVPDEEEQGFWPQASRVLSLQLAMREEFVALADPEAWLFSPKWGSSESNG